MSLSSPPIFNFPIFWTVLTPWDLIYSRFALSDGAVLGTGNGAGLGLGLGLGAGLGDGEGLGLGVGLGEGDGETLGLRLELVETDVDIDADIDGDIMPLDTYGDRAFDTASEILLGEAPLLTKGEIDLDMDCEISERARADNAGALAVRIWDMAVGDTARDTAGRTLITG